MIDEKNPAVVGREKNYAGIELLDRGLEASIIYVNETSQTRKNLLPK